MKGTLASFPSSRKVPPKYPRGPARNHMKAGEATARANKPERNMKVPLFRSVFLLLLLRVGPSSLVVLGTNMDSFSGWVDAE